MKSIFQSIRKPNPWLALAFPVVLYGFLSILQAINPGLFCMAVNPGGKEFICGFAYSHVSVRILTVIALVGWIFFLVVTSVTVFRGKPTIASRVAWAFSALAFLALVALWLTIPNSDSP